MNDVTFRRAVVIAIILAGAALYAPILAYPGFLFDDGTYLLENPLIQDLGYFARLLEIGSFARLDEQLHLSTDVTTNFMMRPLTYLSFALNYQVAGFNAAAFRGVNVAIHILNALLVFACSDRLLQAAPQGQSPSRFSGRFIPLTTAAIFLLHPVQTGSVTYITQRLSSFAALFFLLTVWLYLRWSWCEQRGDACDRLRWLTAGVLLLGMLAGESLFGAPLLILLLEMTILGHGPRTALRRAAPLLMLLPVVPVMVAVVSAAQNSVHLSLTGTLNIVNYGTTPAPHYALTQLVVIAAYLRLYLFPYGQNVDHDPPLHTDPTAIPVVAAMVVIAALVGGALLLYRKNRDDRRAPLVLVGISWFFLALAPSSSIIPLPDLMAEHRTYLASVGLILALVTLIDLLRTGLTLPGRPVLIGVAIWCVLLAVMTHHRNRLWQSGILLWSDAVSKSPEKARPWLNLGTAHLTAGNYHEAHQCLRRAIAIDPNWGLAYEILATAHLRLKQYRETVAISRQGIAIDQANPVIFNNLGIAYAELGRNDDARQAFSTALALRPNYRMARDNLDRLETVMATGAGRQK